MIQFSRARLASELSHRCVTAVEECVLFKAVLHHATIAIASVQLCLGQHDHIWAVGKEQLLELMCNACKPSDIPGKIVRDFAGSQARGASWPYFLVLSQLDWPCVSLDGMRKFWQGLLGIWFAFVLFAR